MPLQVVCVERSGPSRDHRHVAAVGITTGTTILRFSVRTVRQLIKKGTVTFYCLDRDGRRVEVRRYRCACGRGTIRTGADDLADGALSELSSCGH